MTETRASAQQGGEGDRAKMQMLFLYESGREIQTGGDLFHKRCFPADCVTGRTSQSTPWSVSALVWSVGTPCSSEREALCAVHSESRGIGHRAHDQVTPTSSDGVLLPKQKALIFCFHCFFETTLHEGLFSSEECLWDSPSHSWKSTEAF